MKIKADGVRYKSTSLAGVLLNEYYDDSPEAIAARRQAWEEKRVREQAWEKRLMEEIARLEAIAKPKLEEWNKNRVPLEVSMSEKPRKGWNCFYWLYWKKPENSTEEPVLADTERVQEAFVIKSPKGYLRQVGEAHLRHLQECEQLRRQWWEKEDAEKRERDRRNSLSPEERKAEDISWWYRSGRYAGD